MSSIHTTTTTTNSTTAPVAGWLTKMISLPFGRSRWISRFFVLLDSELRFYKDEHSDCASQIINLRKVCQVIPTRTAQHPFCFRLEPYTSDMNDVKPWIIECKSEIDMESWVAAIQYRINKYSSSIASPTIHIASPPKTPNTNETSNTRVVSSYSMINNTSPEFYRVATLPLRCTNLISNDEDEKESLLMRRKKKLAPINTQQQQEQQAQAIISPPSTCSSTGLISPTGAVLGTLISPGIIDRYSQYNKQQVSDDSRITQQGDYIVHHQERSESPSSPTYLKYKQKFHL